MWRAIQRFVKRSDSVASETSWNTMRNRYGSNASMNTPLPAQLEAQYGDNPLRLMAQLDKRWQNGSIPMTEDFLHLYFNAAAEARVLNSPNLAVLAKRLSSARAAESAMVNANVAAEGANVGLNPTAMATARAAAQGQPISTFNRYRYEANPFSANSVDRPLYVSNRSTTGNVFVSALSSALPMLLFTLFWFAVLNDNNKSNKSAPQNSIVKQVDLTGENVRTFADVVGVDEAKDDLQEIVHYLRDADHFTRLGGKLPKGVLLTGPPGTGKTLLAKAIAGEANVPFFHVSGSEFDEMYVGVGAKRVRELFEAARQKSPAIIFIDEIDAVGGKRNEKDSTSNKMTLNQLLVEMDGFSQNSGVIVIAATNHADSLDPALTRPGRFDKQVTVDLPDIGGRKAILEHYAKKIPLSTDVNVVQLALGTPGFSGAELHNLLNLAALKCSVEGSESVTMQALEYAKDKIMMGAEMKGRKFSEETRRTTAFHEAGHALAALATPGARAVHKATITPRGRALGLVMQLADDDQTSFSYEQMLASLDVALAGRVAEELLLGPDDVTSGASQDFQYATRLARTMVTQYGYSESVGLMVLNTRSADASDEQRRIVDEEIRKILNQSYNRVKKLLTERKDSLSRIAEGLLSFDYLSGSELVTLMDGGSVDPNARSENASRPAKLPVPFDREKLPPMPARKPPVTQKPAGIYTGSGSPLPSPLPVPIATSAVSPKPSEGAESPSAAAAKAAAKAAEARSRAEALVAKATAAKAAAAAAAKSSSPNSPNPESSSKPSDSSDPPKGA